MGEDEVWVARISLAACVVGRVTAVARLTRAVEAPNGVSALLGAGPGLLYALINVCGEKLHSHERILKGRLRRG